MLRCVLRGVAVQAEARGQGLICIVLCMRVRSAKFVVQIGGVLAIVGAQRALGEGL